MPISSSPAPNQASSTPRSRSPITLEVRKPTRRRRSTLLQAALDNLVSAGILGSARRPNIEYPIWASVHGLAVLLRGPLRSLPERDRMRLEDQMLAFIGAAVS